MSVCIELSHLHAVLYPKNSIPPTAQELEVIAQKLHSRCEIKGKSRTGNTKPEIQMFKRESPAAIRVPYSTGHKLLHEFFTRLKFASSPTVLRQPLSHQKSVISHSIKMLYDNGCVALALRTGFGKTFISLYCAISALQGTGVNFRIAVICQSSRLPIQWCQSLYAISDQYKCWGMSGKNTVLPESTASCINDATFLCLHVNAIETLSDEIRKSVMFLIIDETHLFCTQNYVNALMQFTPLHVIGCSATPTNANGLYGAIEKIIGSDRITVDGEVSVKFVAYDIRCSVDENAYLSAPNNSNLKLVEYGIMERSLAYSEVCNVRIADLCIREVIAGRKILVITKFVKQCRMICDLVKLRSDGKITSGTFVESDTTFDGFADVLVGITQKTVCGFDQDTALAPGQYDRRFNMAILCQTTSQPKNLIQAIGRCARSSENPVFYWLHYPGIKVFEKHLHEHMLKTQKNAEFIHDPAEPVMIPRNPEPSNEQ